MSATQIFEGALRRALGKSSRVGKSAQACRDWLPFIARSLTVEMQIDEVSRRLLIVSDKVAHHDIEHIVVDRNYRFEARHDVDLTTIPIKGQHFVGQ